MNSMHSKSLVLCSLVVGVIASATSSSLKSANFLTKCKALNGLTEKSPRHVLDFEDIAGSRSKTKRCLINVSCVVPSKKIDFQTTYLCSVKPSGKCETLDECIESMKTQSWEAFVEANSAAPVADPMRRFGRRCINQGKGDFIIEGEHRAPDQDKTGVCFKELKCTDANGVEEHLPEVICSADPVTLVKGKKGTCPSNEECWSKRYDIPTEDTHITKVDGQRQASVNSTVARSSSLPASAKSSDSHSDGKSSPTSTTSDKPKHSSKD